MILHTGLCEHTKMFYAVCVSTLHDVPCEAHSKMFHAGLCEHTLRCSTRVCVSTLYDVPSTVGPPTHFPQCTPMDKNLWLYRMKSFPFVRESPAWRSHLSHNPAHMQGGGLNKPVHMGQGIPTHHSSACYTSMFKRISRVLSIHHYH